jgi:hypothetical protein
VRNPTHFKVISNRDLIDYAHSSTLMGINAQTQALIGGLFREAAAAGQLRAGGIETHVLASRALVYGLARMAADGHLPQAGVGVDAAASLERAVELFVDSLVGPTPQSQH